MQTAILPPETITSGDYYATTVVFKNIDYSAADITADVRTVQTSLAPLLASWTIDSQTFSTDTTIQMHLEVEDTRAIGDANGGWWDMQLDLGGGIVLTPIAQQFNINQDVTRTVIVP